MELKEMMKAIEAAYNRLAEAERQVAEAKEELYKLSAKLLDTAK